jgi:flagellar motor switch protein FliG
MDPDAVEDLAVEVAYMDASGLCDRKKQSTIAREFCNSLKQNQSYGLNIGRFFNEMLINIIGEEKAGKIRSQIQKATLQKDLFTAIRSASVDELMLAMEGEHPQTIAAVLSELSPKKIQEILSILPEEERAKTVWKMTSPDLLRSSVKQRIATMITERLKGLKGETLTAKPGRKEENLRNLAIVLSGLEKEIRNHLLDEITKQDEDTCLMIKRLMITWEDIVTIADRSLQESLRNVESSTLAIAIFGADEEIIQKIRSNISERVMDILDEEISLMQDPLEKEVLDAREQVVTPLREANEEGKLRMESR